MGSLLKIKKDIKWLKSKVCCCCKPPGPYADDAAAAAAGVEIGYMYYTADGTVKVRQV